MLIDRAGKGATLLDSNGNITDGLLKYAYAGDDGSGLYPITVATSDTQYVYILSCGYLNGDYTEKMSMIDNKMEIKRQYDMGGGYGPVMQIFIVGNYIYRISLSGALQMTIING